MSYQGLTHSESDEWYTPPEIFDLLGLEFDLDVASPKDRTHCCVPAKRFLTIEDDALSQHWSKADLIWMNPPFGKRNGHLEWFNKLFLQGNGVGLCRAYTSAVWWHDIIRNWPVVVFPRGKTRFINAQGVVGTSPSTGIALLGIGKRAVTKMLEIDPAKAWVVDNRKAQWQTAMEDAIRRPMGVVPTSAEGLITEEGLERAEGRRLSKSTVDSPSGDW
jgi:phage N-6-adenine-methyltransferase